MHTFGGSPIVTDLLSILAELDDRDREQFLHTLKDHERTLLLGVLADSAGLDIPLEDHERIQGEDDARIVMFMAGATLTSSVLLIRRVS